MDLSEDITIYWEARDPARNMARFYRVSVSTDLFGVAIVERAWGRCGSRPRNMRQSFSSRADAEVAMRQVYARRASARQRIGTDYKMVA